MQRCRFFPVIIVLAFLASCALHQDRENQASNFRPSKGAHSTLNVPASSLPGPRPDGSVLLPNQWALRPVGRQVELGDFPVNIAVHPAGQFAAVLHAGHSQHEILIVDLTTAAVIDRTRIKEAFYGLAFSADGKHLFCSGAGDEVVHSFTFENGAVTNHGRIHLHPTGMTGVPAGLCVDKAGEYLFAANVWGHRVTKVRLGAEPQISDIPLSASTNALKSSPVTPSSDFDTAAADKRAQAALYGSNSNDAFPYACRLDEKRQRLYTSLWAQAAVAVIDLKTSRVIAHWPTEEHPCEMALTRSGQFLFVANANRNTVTVIDTARGRTVETICAALYPQAPPGSTPNSLALSPDEQMLFVANADNNMVAVFDVSRPGKARSLGFIPAGWYPTSVRVTPDGKKLLIANGKGNVPRANALGPQPGLDEMSTNRTVQYIGSLFRGTLSLIDLPTRKTFEQQLTGYTAQAYKCTPLRADASVAATASTENPIPTKPGGASPIKYCLYVIKENRTYDQVLGDMPEGNGDPKLCLFPERVTPNMHALAREFVLLDNFYVDGEVSADGHEWSMGAYATDFVEKTWPLDYGHNQSGKFPYPSEGNFPIAVPAGGYIWDRAREAGVSYRSYGEFVTPAAKLSDPGRSRVKTLEGHFDPWYRGFDLGYPDVKRAERFISELKRFETEGDMPRLQILRLPNDHTHGATPGLLTPTAYVADNDVALGMLVEAVSRSKFWPQIAIFVVEDDAQNGPDHVDAHRTTAFVISPYAKRRVVDSTMYSTSSMLRTIELILGLKPMSQFDAAARPMFNAFQSAANPQLYQGLPANVSLDEKNTRHAWGGQIKMNFSKEDAADDLLLNEVVWRSVRGHDSPMPPPIRAAFVFTHPEGDDDD
ncbi:MAG TPA: alkaline phosphatase family protein [Candidatus Limnocylindrales bacterium]|nr:alkaline phosphatase family protein [Candidatus Limnocylindrales bacterium]